jgi:2-aminoadipate transaminase
MRAHVRKIRQLYRERRDLMLENMEKHFPPEAQWTRPLGGLFLWVRLPAGIDTQELLNRAVQQKVAFVPGHAFYPAGSEDGHNCMRLNFSNANPEMIAAGIERLGRAIRQQMAELGG